MEVSLVYFTLAFVGTLLADFGQGLSIDNAVMGIPNVVCEPNAVMVNFTVKKPFGGRIFVKGFAEKPSCARTGRGDMALSIAVNLADCGMQRIRSVAGFGATNKSSAAGKGMTATQVVIISFHNLFITKVDRAYRVNCFYMETSKTITSALEVSMIPDSEVTFAVPMPTCKYEILKGDIEGPPIKYANVGQQVFHKWTCSSEHKEMFCMRVHSCLVADGENRTYPILDEHGCSVDRYVLQSLSYMGDLSAGQEAHVFKFADSPAVMFNCQIELRMKQQVAPGGCQAIQPKCPETFEGTHGVFIRSVKTGSRLQASTSLGQGPSRGNSSIGSGSTQLVVPSQALFVVDLDERDPTVDDSNSKSENDWLQLIKADDANSPQSVCFPKASFFSIVTFGTVLLLVSCLILISLAIYKRIGRRRSCSKGSQ